MGGDDSVPPLAYQDAEGLKAMTMHYVSTRGAAPVLGFGEAMMTGLARDGGLYVPEAVPVLTKTEMGTVKSRIARARSKLQEILTPYLQGQGTQRGVTD